MALDKEMSRINRRIGQLLKAGERDVAKQYAGALLKMRGMMAAQYERFEQGGELSLQEMLKHDRLEKLMQEMNHLLKAHYKDVNGAMERILGGVYEDGYYLTAWAVENEVKQNLGYAAVRPETLTAMAAAPVAGLTLNSRLELQRSKIIYQIQQQVTQGLAKNETYATMARRLKSELEGDAVKAMRIVRTEGHRVQESAKHDAAEHANNNGVIMMKEWNTMEDSRVRRGKSTISNHVQLNGEKIPTDGVFNDGLGEGLAPGQLGAAGSDINCRCFLTYSVERVERVDAAVAEKTTFDKWKTERDI